MSKNREVYDYLKSFGILAIKRYGSLIIDYHNFSYPGMPQEDRKRLDIGSLYINAAKCKVCGWFIRSKNRHDYVECKCGAIAVDGGSWYARRIGKEEDREDIIVRFEEC